MGEKGLVDLLWPLELISNLFLATAHVGGAADSGFGLRWKKLFASPPLPPSSEEAPTKNYTLSVAYWLSFGVKGLICTVDR